MTLNPDFDDFDLTSMNVCEPVFGASQGKTLLKVHPRHVCEGREIPCCIHNPSEHHMRTWDMNWRGDTSVMERICPHGVGHPDPDHIAFVISVDERMIWQAGHGCDGCCRSAYDHLRNNG